MPEQHGCTGAPPRRSRTSGSKREEVKRVTKARLIYAAVMLLLIVQALFLAIGTPSGFYDGN